MSTPGVSPRLFPATAWAGDRLLVYGGIEPRLGEGCESKLLNDAYLVDVESGQAQALAAPPFGEPLSASEVVAAGDVTVVLGALCGLDPGELSSDDGGTCKPGTHAAATFDHKSHTWQPVSLPDSIVAAEVGSVLTAGSTSAGDAVFIVGTKPEGGDSPVTEIWLYSPGDARWTMVPLPESTVSDVCVAGDQLLAFTPKWQEKGTIVDASPVDDLEPGESATAGPSDGYVLPSFAILDVKSVASEEEADSWRAGAAMPDVQLGADYNFTTACIEGFALLANKGTGLRELYRYEAERDSWTSVPAAPTNFFVTRLVAAGSAFYFLPSESQTDVEGAALDARQLSWRSLPGLPPVLRGALWNGDSLVGYSEPIAATAKFGSAPSAQRTRPRAPGVFRVSP